MDLYWDSAHSQCYDTTMSAEKYVAIDNND